MKTAPAAATRQPRRRMSRRGGTQLVILGIMLFAAGIALGILTHSCKPQAPRAEPESALSASTLAVLNGLDRSVEIRFYSLFDPATVTDTQKAFAQRVDQLLTRCERQARGRLRITRHATPSDAATRAAAADGLTPFNLDHGEPSYLGLAIAAPDRSESLAQLAPEWEPALEYDIARAISRVSAPAAPPAVPRDTSAADAAAAADVRELLPNLASLSRDQATQALREQALQDFKNAASEMAARLAEAQQQATDAERAQSEAAQQAALRRIRELHAEQTARLKQIADRLQARLAALEKLKPAEP